MTAEINTRATHRHFLYAKSRPEEQYKNGQIMLNGEDSFWILAGIHNESYCPAHNVRIAIDVPHSCGKSVTVRCRIFVSDDTGASTEAAVSEIEFISDRPFSLEYNTDSAFMYSEAYGLDSSHLIRLDNSIMQAGGCPVGFRNTTDDIPGGNHNTVTVSIGVKVKYAAAYDDNSVYCTYIGHSSFMLEYPDETLLFDWAEGSLPSIRQDKPLYIFISHVHQDHFRREALMLAASHPETEIFLGYDREIRPLNEMLDALPQEVKNSITLVSGNRKYSTRRGDIDIETLRSTDLGVAFLLDAHGKKIYHAGDLFLMNIQDRQTYEANAHMLQSADSRYKFRDYDDELRHNANEFEDYTYPLMGKLIDYAMLPLDPRGEANQVAYHTISRYMDISIIKNWSPMHLWRHYDFVDRFLSEHPEYAPNMIGPASYNGVKQSVQVGERFRLGIG